MLYKMVISNDNVSIDLLPGMFPFHGKLVIIANKSVTLMSS